MAKNMPYATSTRPPSSRVQIVLTDDAIQTIEEYQGITGGVTLASTITELVMKGLQFSATAEGGLALDSQREVKTALRNMTARIKKARREAAQARESA